MHIRHRRDYDKQSSCGGVSIITRVANQTRSMLYSRPAQHTARE